jgi:hypothetical protein
MYFVTLSIPKITAGRRKMNDRGRERDREVGASSTRHKFIIFNLDLLLSHLRFPSKAPLQLNLKRRSCALGTRQT